MVHKKFDEDLKETLFKDSDLDKNYHFKATVQKASQLFQHRVETRRWWILFMFFLFGIANNVAWTTYSGIIESSKVYFDADLNQIVWFSMVYSVAYITFSFAGSWACEKNLAISLIAGTFLNATGGWIRYFAKRNYAITMIGQCFAGFTEIFTMFTPMIIAEHWFPPKERFKAVTIGCLSNSFGVGVGYIFSPLLYSLHIELDRITFIIAIMMTVPFVLSLFVMRDRPKMAPNLSTVLHKEESFKHSMIYLLKNRRFILSALSFALSYAVSWNTIAVLGDYLSDNGFSQLTVGIVGFIYIIFGIISGFTGTLFIEKVKHSRKHFDVIIKAFMILGTTTLIFLVVFISSSNLGVIIFLLSMMGVGFLAYQPFACQSLAETGFPVPEGISVNFFFFAGETFNLLLSNLSTLESVGKNGKWFSVGAQVPSFIYLVFFFKTSFKKTRSEGSFSVFNDEKCDRKFFDKIGSISIKDDEIAHVLQGSGVTTQISHHDDGSHLKSEL